MDNQVSGKTLLEIGTALDDLADRLSHYSLEHWTEYADDTTRAFISQAIQQIQKDAADYMAGAAAIELHAGQAAANAIKAATKHLNESIASLDATAAGINKSLSIITAGLKVGLALVSNDVFGAVQAAVDAANAV